MADNLQNVWLQMWHLHLHLYTPYVCTQYTPHISRKIYKVMIMT